MANDFDLQQKELLSNFGIDATKIRPGSALLVVNIDGATNILGRFFDDATKLREDDMTKAVTAFMAGIQWKLQDHAFRDEIIKYAITMRPNLFVQENLQ